ncbi:MAG: 50S ribosomal protein L35 [Calditrichaeota bacterium]|nr:MAG: 50S ribosomal protein L35 [Calditrichota bacterium]
MPKMKTNRAAAKRFKKTGTGKIKRFKAYKSHILTKKTRKRKRNLRQSTIASVSDMNRLSIMLPY